LSQYTRVTDGQTDGQTVFSFYENRPFCVFETPFGGLRGNVRGSS